MGEIVNQSANKNLRRGNPAWGKKAEGNGKSGNPKGHPGKNYSITLLVKAEIDKIPANEKQGRTWRQLLALAWLTGAMRNPVLFKELLDRLEGKVVQPIGGENGQPIKAEVNITVSSENSKTLTQEILKGKGTG